jgi:hypothetical protein
MPTDQPSKPEPPTGEPARKDVSEQAVPSSPAERALVEAAARRAERDSQKIEQPKEVAGRAGPEPTRYGDWEINGVASDF